MIELIRRTSAEIPDDVQKAILDSFEREKKGTLAESALKIIDRNIALAKQKSQPICQDTGSILFYVDGPVGMDEIAFEDTACLAVKKATKLGHLRQNSVAHGNQRRHECRSGLANVPFSPAPLERTRRAPGSERRWLRKRRRTIFSAG